IGNYVIIGAGAKILGDIRIGNNCIVGSGSVVVKDVPDNSTVVGIPARLILKDGQRVEGNVEGINYGLMPDPVAQAVKCVLDQTRAVQADLDALKGRLEVCAEASEDKPKTGGPPDQETLAEEAEILDVFMDGSGI
ncbi:MAG: serine O-acetyltransferase, partial [bacterium]